jgi:prolipoprotein diacylglyceryltransferase
VIGVLHITIDPVAVQLGALSVHWYGILCAVAFAAGFRFGVLPHLLPRRVSRGDCDRTLVWAIVAGLLGARLYYVVQQPLFRPFVHPPDDHELTSETWAHRSACRVRS